MKYSFIALLTMFITSPSYAIEVINEYATPPSPPSVSIIVNKSDYTMSVYRDEEVVNTHRVIIGKPGRNTPSVETEFSHIELNPIWDVPASLVDDMVRKFKGKKNPVDYITRLKYRLISHSGTQLDPSTIDWKTISSKGPYDFILKQDPGPYNMLGQVMFNLKRTGGIQMHGTSNPELFERDVRRFSSGCVRVDQANALAASLLGKTDAEFKQLLKRSGNKWYRLNQPVKVSIID